MDFDDLEEPLVKHHGQWPQPWTLRLQLRQEIATASNQRALRSEPDLDLGEVCLECAN